MIGRVRRAVRQALRNPAREQRLVDDARRLESEKFARMNWDLEAAIARLEGLLPVIGRSAPFRRESDSVHWVLLSAIADDKSLRIERLLEIGTHDGRFARLASELFPAAQITTVDLPETDPVFRSIYPDLSARKWTKVRDARATNLARSNIQFQAVNSFFLPEACQPGFDLVWVDAGHTYPEVAWDCCNAYHLCRDGALLMTDDILPDAAVGRTGLVSRATWEMLEVMDKQGITRTELFLKRLNADSVGDPRARKYVGVSRVSKRNAGRGASNV